MADMDSDRLHYVHPLPRRKVIDDMGHAGVMMILKNQRIEIEEVIETIQDNITQWRSDLDVCIPELQRILYDLMEDHFSFIKHLASMLGGEHPMIRIINKESDHLIDAANEMMYQANVILREAESNSVAYMDDHQETIQVVSGSSWFAEQSIDSVETDQSPDNHVAETDQSRAGTPGAATIHGMIPTTIRTQAQLEGDHNTTNSAQHAEVSSTNLAQHAEVISTNSAQHAAGTKDNPAEHCLAASASDAPASHIGAQPQACLTSLQGEQSVDLTDVSQLQASTVGNTLSDLSTTTQSDVASCQSAMAQYEQPGRAQQDETKVTHQSAEHFVAEEATQQSAAHFVAEEATQQSAPDFMAEEATHQSAAHFVTEEANQQSAAHFVEEEATPQPAAHIVAEEATLQSAADFLAEAATHQSAAHFVADEASDHSATHFVATEDTDQSEANFVATESTNQSEAKFMATEATDQSATHFVATEDTDQSEANFVATESTDQSEANFVATESTDQSEAKFVATEATNQSAAQFADHRETRAATFRPARDNPAAVTQPAEHLLTDANQSPVIQSAEDCVAADYRPAVTQSAEALPTNSPNTPENRTNLNNKHNLGTDNMQRLKSRQSSGSGHLELFYPPATSSTHNYSLEPVILLFASLLIYAATMTLRKCCNAKGWLFKEFIRSMSNTLLPSWLSRAAPEQLTPISTGALSYTETLGTNPGKGNHNRKPQARQRIKILTCFLSIFAAIVLGHSLELNNTWTMDQKMRIQLSSVDPTRKSTMGTFMFDKDNVITRDIPSLAFSLDITSSPIITDQQIGQAGEAVKIKTSADTDMSEYQSLNLYHSVATHRANKSIVCTIGLHNAKPVVRISKHSLHHHIAVDKSDKHENKAIHVVIPTLIHAGDQYDEQVHHELLPFLLQEDTALMSSGIQVGASQAHPRHLSKVISISSMSCPANNITGFNKSKDDFVWFAKKATNAPVDSELHKTEKKELARQNMFDSMDLKSTGVVTFDEWYKFSMEHILAKMATLEPHPIRDHSNLEQFKTFLKAALAVGSTENNEFDWFLLEHFTEHDNDKDGIITLSDFLPAYQLSSHTAHI